MSLLREISDVVYGRTYSDCKLRSGHTSTLYGTRRGCDGVHIMSRTPLIDESTLQQRIKDYARNCNTLNPVRTYRATAEEISSLFANVRPMHRKSMALTGIWNR